MPSEIIFLSVDDSRPIPTEELYQQLVGVFETPWSLGVHETGGQLVLSEVGIVLSLIFDEIGNPVTVVAEIPHDARVEHVSLLCGVFRDMGWES